MNYKSKKQKTKDIALMKIKKTLPHVCAICGKAGPVEGAHLLPRSLYMEYYTKPENIVPLCHTCHYRYDNDIRFRKRQTKLIKRVQSFDKLAANRHFRLYDE
jgi:5-methylcytosine-specific restriction endonuclease McrA